MSEIVATSLSKPNQDDGFSSESQQQSEILYTAQQPMQLDEPISYDDIKTKLHNEQVRDVISKSYSLQPDMIHGWSPKIQLPKPIPLSFINCDFDEMIDKAITECRILNQRSVEGGDHSLQLCYLGARYETTYYAWFDKEFQFPYKHLSAPKNVVLTDRAFVGQHWDAQKLGLLEFDSLFESGNLDCAIKVAPNQYDLFMRVDSNTRGHLQWFNFRVRNLEPGKSYRLNMCNFQKGKNLYTRGMRPYCFSLKKNEHERMGWHQLTSQIKYRKKSSKTQKLLQYESQFKCFQLSFQISTIYPQDELQLSYCIPYTYSRMCRYIAQLVDNCQSRNILATRKLCTSLGGHPVEELTITANADEEEQAFKKKVKLNKRVIFVTGRCHPGETNGSWMVEGLIDFLCGYSPIAQFLRHNVIFKIIPMLNPDGVILGNYRTGLYGKDFNRQFNCPDKDIFPEIYHLKAMFWNYKLVYRDHAFFYLDFHGHSVKRNVFAYGPQYPIIHRNYYESRLISKLIALKSKMFRYHSCIFKISESKESTGRAIFLKSHKIPFTFTIEASNGSYYDQEKSENLDFDEHKWKEVGEKVIEGVYEYLKLIIELEKIRNEKLRERKQIMLRNRQRAKPKKNRSSKGGYFTSTGFRKCKTSNKEQITEMAHDMDPPIAISDLIKQINMFEGNDEITSILDQIKNDEKEDPEKEKKKFSDDEISEGKSDSESEKDDLEEQQRRQLLAAIKEKKRKKKIGEKRIQTSLHQRQESTKKIQIESPNEAPIAKQNPKVSSKEIYMRKYLWKKKNSISPKRDEQSNLNNSLAAKIVSFNFSLNPIECVSQPQIETISNLNSTYNGQKINSNFCLTLKNEEKLNYLANKKIHGKNGTDYSDSFKKTFLTVQKEILRRDSQKRYLVSLNNSQNRSKPKNNWIVENARVLRTSNQQCPNEISLLSNFEVEYDEESPVKSRGQNKTSKNNLANKLSTKTSKNQSLIPSKEKRFLTEDICGEDETVKSTDRQERRTQGTKKGLKLGNEKRRCMKEEYEIEQ